VELSVIIVNYNVKYFLEQCLFSVVKALEGIQGEIFVVDNHSPDRSVEYLQQRFDRVRFLVNEKNEGFAKANNRALLEAKGKYILFLNPDTIVDENCFTQCIAFLDARPEAGALGIRMINGAGHYLKESKRGFPTPWVAFCKMSGLTALFPTSRLFSKYYLGYLDERSDQVIDAISGAFFFARKQALDKTGGFDEQFFMYAEDIDLSYRIQRSGFVNMYLGGTTIIHFKGESTKKDFRYVRLFYKAMSQFIKKYSFGGGSAIFTGIIHMAIRCRAGIALVGKSMGTKPAGKKDGSGFFLLGSAQSMEKLRKWAAIRKLPVYDAAEDAEEIILCEGRDFSFGRIIRLIEASTATKIYRIHAAGSHSIVGSNSKDKTGQTIALY
jgi:N-acetylglucosaminyl-diphospho-decaprenol L-rhamnosyltransferase